MYNSDPASMTTAKEMGPLQYYSKIPATHSKLKMCREHGALVSWKKLNIRGYRRKAKRSMLIGGSHWLLHLHRALGGAFG